MENGRKLLNILREENKRNFKWNFKENFNSSVNGNSSITKPSTDTTDLTLEGIWSVAKETRFVFQPRSRLPNRVCSIVAKSFLLITFARILGCLTRVTTFLVLAVLFSNLLIFLSIHTEKLAWWGFGCEFANFIFTMFS